MGAAKYGKSFKQKLRLIIDTILPGCKDFGEFLTRMRVEDYEIKRRGRSLKFRTSDQQNFTCAYRLGDDYTEEILRGKNRRKAQRRIDKGNSKDKTLHHR